MTEPVFVFDPARDPALAAQVAALLQTRGLRPEADIEVFAVALDNSGQRRVIGCAGLAGHVVKCVCVDPAWQGEALSLRLGMVLLRWAGEAGRDHLFLYTRPDNRRFFRGWGFYPLVEVPGQVLCMENSSHALADYCRRLSGQRQAGARIGGLVMNANPFTLGHRALVEQALALCDWVHLFVVKEEGSAFAYPDRLRLVQEGVRPLERVTVHPGSDYVLSRATFPGYFLPDKQAVDHGWAVLDILIFRQYIAPALGITDRFVGEEPFDLTTRQYNAELSRWLTDPGVAAPRVQLHIGPRLQIDGGPVSASQVRHCLQTGDFDAIARRVPPATLQFLRSRYPSGQPRNQGVQ